MLPHFELNVTAVRDAAGRLTSVSKTFFFLLHLLTCIHSYPSYNFSVPSKGTTEEQKGTIKTKSYSPGLWAPGKGQKIS